jgi:hypothetical protein
MAEDAPSNEIATMVVENNTDTRSAINVAYDAMKGQNLQNTEARNTWDFISIRHPELLPISKIIDVPHFVLKRGAPLIQIADACAMTIRHCLEGREDALPFIEALSVEKPGKIHMSGRFLANASSAGYNILTYSKPENLVRPTLGE